MANADNAADIAQLRRALCTLLGLTVEPEWEAGIDGHLAVLMDNVRLIEDVALADDVDPAPVFEVGR